MITVRSIIVEALQRSNLVSRRQSAPADMVETAFRLLKGIASKYSNDNLLQFVVAEVDRVLDKREFVIGGSDGSDEYLPVDIDAKDIQKINKVYWRPRVENGMSSYVELDYAAPDSFDSYPAGTAVYTAQPINDLQIVLKTKLVADTNTEIRISYNRKWNFGLDSEMRIPDQYGELFIVSLTHKLALTFPRLSTEQVNLLKTELAEMENNVKVSSRAIKFVGRRNAVAGINRADFYSGRMFIV